MANIELSVLGDDVMLEESLAPRISRRRGGTGANRGAQPQQ
jgi:hypothetical protein